MKGVFLVKQQIKSAKKPKQHTTLIFGLIFLILILMPIFYFSSVFDASNGTAGTETQNFTTSSKADESLICEFDAGLLEPCGQQTPDCYTNCAGSLRCFFELESSTTGYCSRSKPDESKPPGFYQAPKRGSRLATGRPVTIPTPSPPGLDLVKRATMPAKFFSPYIDATSWPLFDATNCQKKIRQNWYTFGFVVADPNKQPSFGGYSAYSIPSFNSAQFSAIRRAGGDIIISFGGAAGSELALVITDQASLLKAYQSVVTGYNLKFIDFDIEGAALNNQNSINLRSNVLAQLKLNNPGLRISVTLPVLPTGLNDAGKYVIQSALNYKLTYDGIQI